MVRYEAFQSGQARILFDYWPKVEPRWMIVGGPADGDEAQVVRERFQWINCLGVEPHPEFCALQKGLLEFPGEVVEAALWHEEAPLILELPKIGVSTLASMRSGTVGDEGWLREQGLLPSPGDSRARRDLGRYTVREVLPVRGVTLDSLAQSRGVRRCILWLDIEFSEMNALRGATDLLERGEVLLVNLETFEDKREEVDGFLRQYNLIPVHQWNEGVKTYRCAQDVIYARGDL